MRIQALALAVLVTFGAFSAQLPAQRRASSRMLRNARQPVSVHRNRVVVTALDVDIQVSGPVARVTHDITLHNRTRLDAEFDLVFPLGKDESITGADLRMGGQTLEGIVYGRAEAARIYRQLTRKLGDPALLEHYGERLFRARVFPVPARGEVTLTLAYDQVIRPEADLMRIHVPLTAFRRVAGPLDLGIRGTIQSRHGVSTLYSPTHALSHTTGRPSSDELEHVREFALRQNKTRPDLDFVAYYKARGNTGLIDVSVLSDRPDPKKPGYFLAVVNGIPDADLEPEPRDVVFVIDRSGSMQGKKIEQAKAALAFLIARLRPEDRFNLITYAAGVDTFESGLVSPTADMMATALTYAKAIESGGGTNIQGALQAALAHFKDGARMNQVIFLTDGLPTVGERDHRKICAQAKKANEHRARIIAFGVGHDVNGAFLDRLAVQNNGLSEYVLPTENIEDKVPGFYSRMQSPLLLDAKLTFQSVKVMDVFPRQTGDIYGGHQVLVTGRYLAPGPARFVVTGRRGDQRHQFTHEIDLAAGSRGDGNQIVPRVWADKKIGYLVDEIRLNGKNPELVNEIVRLGQRFGILTEYTSFLAAPTTDLGALEANRKRAADEVAGRTGRQSGSHGVAQAANSKRMQRRAQVETKNRWLGSDGREVEVGGVQNLRGRAFFKRGETWVHGSISAEQQKTAVEIPYFSEEFFKHLERNPWLNQCVARTGDVTVELEGRVVRFRRGD